MCFFKKRRAQKKAIEAEKARLAQEEAVEKAVEQPVEVKPEVKVVEKPVEVKSTPEVAPESKVEVVAAVVEPKVTPVQTTEPTPQVKESSESKTPKVAKYHVSQNKDEDSDNFKKWRVRKEGSTKTIKFFDTQKEAIEFAESLAESAGSSVVIHKVDGSIRKQDYTKKA
jgi:hypothetical protein